MQHGKPWQNRAGLCYRRFLVLGARLLMPTLTQRHKAVSGRAAETALCLCQGKHYSMLVVSYAHSSSVQHYPHQRPGLREGESLTQNTTAITAFLFCWLHEDLYSDFFKVVKKCIRSINGNRPENTIPSLCPFICLHFSYRDKTFRGTQHPAQYHASGH